MTKKTFTTLVAAITVYLFRQKNPTRNTQKLEKADKINIYIILSSISNKKILLPQIKFIAKYKLILKKKNGRK